MSTGINIGQLRKLVVRPVIKHLDAWSLSAENLILGTIAQESHGSHYIQQLGGGPAVGMCQMEPATFRDIYQNYLKYRPELAAKVAELELPNWYEDHDADEMAGNNYYAVAMCRVHYLRVSEPLPEADDLHGLASYWKRFYNSHFGKGTPQEFMVNYRRFKIGE